MYLNSTIAFQNIKTSTFMHSACGVEVFIFYLLMVTYDIIN